MEPLALVNAVPGDVAGAIGVAVSASVTALWRRIVALEAQNRIDNQAHYKATQEMYQAALEKKDAELDYLRKKAAP